ncbi:unnamed protein product [Caenorhabditis bovis]|uniref:Bestrophin homolog n=1 Tax=Caenorhabditis bovis TaxID=2654633 RepID=A0A8S1F3W3_9PELO|nr:unnamed protein product [Caenorhabditis bovis]
MSVNYSLAAATTTGWSILRVLVLWKGSLWKLVWREMLFWALLFAGVNLSYYYGIRNTSAESTYMSILKIVQEIPLDGTMINAFFGWSETYKLLIWPENIAYLFQQHFNEKAISRKEAKMLKSTICRYLIAFYILVFRDVSTEVRQWFPTLDHFVECNILTNNELKIIKSSRMSENDCKYWVPLDWIALLLKKRYARKYIFDAKGKRVRNMKVGIMTDVGFGDFMAELCRLRGKVSDILSYDWVPLPLALVQTCTVFVYSTLILSSFKMQFRLVNVPSSASMLHEMFVESISTLPINILYLSFLRISQVVINPFGMDDDDFETPYLIERHFNVLQEILCKEHEVSETMGLSCMDQEAAHLGHTLASAMLK